MRNPKVILEGRNDYKAMLAALLDAVQENTAVTIGSTSPLNIGQEFKKRIQDKWDAAIQRAKPILQKEDRMIWYLRFLRQEIIDDLLLKDIFDKEKLRKLITDYERKVGVKFHEDEFRATGNHKSVLEELQHFLSLPIPEIQNYVFKNQSAGEIISFFEAAEAEWKKTVSDMFVDNESEILIDFKNGWYWVDTKKAYCGKEAAAMGHCGNSPRSDTADTILSLRKGKVINGDRYWEPHLTFILNSSGNLTEMKGKGNDKPADRYHEMIIKLLLHPRIEGIVGGGYLPENNFEITDLDPEVAENLIKTKPSLGSSYDLLQMNDGKVTDEIVHRLIDEMESLNSRNLTDYLSVEPSKGDLENMIVYEWDDLLSMAKDLNSSSFEQVVEMAENDFTTVADWIEESDVEKALTIFVEEADHDIEVISSFLSRLSNKLGVDEDDALSALMHVFPRSSQSVFDTWKSDIVSRAKTVGEKFAENITWVIYDLDLVINKNDDGSIERIYLRIPIVELIEMVHTEKQSQYDSPLHIPMTEGWALVENDRELKNAEHELNNFYDLAVDDLIDRLIDLFETEDQLTFDFENGHPYQKSLNLGDR